MDKVENKPVIHNFPVLDVPSRLLLGPGPSMVHPQVLKVMSFPLLGHLDPEFVKLMDNIQTLLRYAFQTENSITVPVSGTGSAAMETAIVNMLEAGDRVVVCINGYFGGRIAEMAQRYGAEVKTIQKAWGEVFSPQDVELALEEFPAQVVAIVHAETSTGALQPLKEIVDVVHTRGGIIIVDAVTSLGGIPLRVDELGIDVCYSGTQKCLSSPPGLGPITLGSKALARLNERKTKVPSWYLDLSMVQQYWGKERTYHHTAPITANYALYESLRLIAKEGLEARWKRHRENAEYLWDGLSELGLECHVPKEHRLHTLTSVKVPDGMDETWLRKELLEFYNIEIAGGLGELKGKIWRIGLMGYSSSKENVDKLLNAFKNILGR